MDNAPHAWELPAMRTGPAALALAAAAAALVVLAFSVLPSGARLARASALAGDPAQELERVRADPALADDPAAIDALARDLQSFPPGPARVEARMLVAEAWLGRMHRPDDALSVLRAVTDDPEADPLTARLAEREIVDALIAEGRLDEAAAEASAHAHRLDPRVVVHTRTLVRRRSLRRVAIAELCIFGALAGRSLLAAFKRGAVGASGRALRRVLFPALGFAVYVAAAGGLLASQYETGNSAPFVLFGLLVVPIVLLARAWAAVGSTRSAARAFRAVICAVSVFAAAFMLLDAVNPAYLEGFGL
jgi:hypothetical protein